MLNDEPDKLKRMKNTTIKEQQEKGAIEEQLDWEWLFSDDRGLRIVHRLLDRAGVFRSQFNTNALTMAFLEGQRNEGNFVFERLGRFAPEKIEKIMQMRFKDV